ncbi:LANO_0E01442g1_1 [Lachancea nothofagi CBS 11611]|uniref:LANO_0E01442g1_1 n=1 Tax=Lachancea nothofagi CBS 11611 TaxID=1266666 RepID=A0A1G4JPR5_9SACH|nr:LANO_0E01442g1_1 [Lachancea nothofagi CBS 11611]
MVTISNAHSELIHDAVLDYYGKRLATCSSDKTIKIFEVENDTHKLVETLYGHEGPVWQVDWAHPKFGVILASCSYDGKVLIWKEENGRWTQIAAHALHSASVNSVQWAPHEYGPFLLAASSDGKVSVVEFKENGTTAPVIIEAHAIGVNTASWASASLQDGTSALQERRFVTGGADNLVKVWKYSPEANTYLLQDTLEGHSDWVRDVAWSPSVLLRSYLASVSQDRTCIIWTQENNQGPWKKTLLKDDKFPDVLWRASWSLSGNILALSGGDNKVTLWKENLEGNWESAGEVEQ